mgnify:CR=1 FL=1
MIILDATALSALLKVGAVHILLETFPSDSFIIPGEVWGEIRKTDVIRAAVDRVLQEHGDRFRVLEVDQQQAALASQLEERLHRGESEAIAIAKLSGARLIMDDLTARTVAKQLSIPIGGTLLVMRLAYEKCPIETYEELKDLINRLSEDLYFNRSLEEWVLQAEKLS